MISTRKHDPNPENTSESVSEGNSIDEFIRNDYVSTKLNDSDYISDDSLKDFLKKLTNQSQTKKKAEISVR